MAVDQRFHDCWFLSGATATGKTSVGLELAEQLAAEIISLDSMAVYRGMDLGTAKATEAEKARVPHHLIDVVDPCRDFSIAEYVELAADKVRAIRAAGKRVLFVGGTPLYLKALLRGLFQGPPADWEFRREVAEEVQRTGSEALHERLAQVDPLTASRLHHHDTRRVIRALEVHRVTGRPISHLQREFEDARSAAECHVYVLRRQRAALHDRIAARVTWMYRAGLVREVERLSCHGRQLGRTAQQAVGYREAIGFLAGTTDMAQAQQTTVVRTRRFARRQETWYRSLSEQTPVMLSETDTPSQVSQRIVALAQTRHPPAKPA